MNRRLWLCPFAIGSLAVVSCSQETSPSEPVVPAAQPASASVAGGTWATKASMPTPRSNLAAGTVNNSLGQPVLYAIGGNNETGWLRTVEAYNFATNSWSTKAKLPLALTLGNGVGVIGGKLYLAGGLFEASGVVGWHPGLNVYDPARNTWTKKADMPKRFAQGVTGVINGKLYVLPGTCNNCGPSTPNRRFYRYDPVTNIWTALPWAPDAHIEGAAGVINGKFYVAGGAGQTRTRLDVYDPATNKWRTLAPMPTPRYGATGAVLQNKLYVIGRSNVDPGEPQNQVEAYDPVTNTWTTKTPIPGAGRGGLAGARVTYQGQSHIVVVGGSDVESSSPGNVTQAYTP